MTIVASDRLVASLTGRSFRKFRSRSRLVAPPVGNLRLRSTNDERGSTWQCGWPSFDGIRYVDLSDGACGEGRLRHAYASREHVSVPSIELDDINTTSRHSRRRSLSQVTMTTTISCVSHAIYITDLLWRNTSAASTSRWTTP